MLPDARCNLHCAYCLNTDCIAGGKDDINTQKIYTLINQANCELISIWGGEPLCNPALEVILRTLRKKYPKKQLSLLTNGTLLNQKFIELFNELDVMVGISHDGPAQALRCKDFLVPAYLEMLAKLKNFTGFNCVVSRQNCDIDKIVAYFKQVHERLPGAWQLTLEMFELTQCDILEHMPSVEQYEKFADMVRGIEAYAGDITFLNTERRRLHSSIPSGWSCGADKRLTIDCAGNIYHCQVMAERNDKRRVENGIPLMCAGCRHVIKCRGICPVMPDSLRKKLCLCRYIYYEMQKTRGD